MGSHNGLAGQDFILQSALPSSPQQSYSAGHRELALQFLWDKVCWKPALEGKAISVLMPFHGFISTVSVLSLQKHKQNSCWDTRVHACRRSRLQTWFGFLFSARGYKHRCCSFKKDAVFFGENNTNCLQCSLSLFFELSLWTSCEMRKTEHSLLEDWTWKFRLNKIYFLPLKLADGIT